MKNLLLFLKSFIYSLPVCFILFSSCSENDFTTDEAVPNEQFTLYAKYKGIDYVVPCVSINNSVVFLNKEFNDLYQNEISLLPNLAVLALSDNVVEYYSTENELQTKSGITFFDQESTSTNEPQTKANTFITGTAILYDDTNFKDTEVRFSIDNTLIYSCPNLKNAYAFNDKTSAIRLFNFIPSNSYFGLPYSGFTYDDPNGMGSNMRIVLIGYQNDTYGGQVLYCISTYSSSEDIYKPETATHQDWKLGNIGWNDKISSVVLRIATLQQVNSSYPPHNPV